VPFGVLILGIDTELNYLYSPHWDHMTAHTHRRARINASLDEGLRFHEIFRIRQLLYLTRKALDEGRGVVSQDECSRINPTFVETQKVITRICATRKLNAAIENSLIVFYPAKS
jgi:hypothetical protein